MGYSQLHPLSSENTVFDQTWTEQKLASGTSTYHRNLLNWLEGVAVTRSTQYISLVKILSHYVPLQLSVCSLLASCTSAYHEFRAYQVSLKSIKPYRRTCTYEIYPENFISKNSKSSYLSLQLYVGNHVASYTSTYHLLPLYQFSLKSVNPYRRSCAYEICPVYFISKNLSLIISPYSCPLVIILLHAHLNIMYNECIKSHWNRSNPFALTRSMDR